MRMILRAEGRAVRGAAAAATTQPPAPRASQIKTGTCADQWPDLPQVKHLFFVRELPPNLPLPLKEPPPSLTPPRPYRPPDLLPRPLKRTLRFVCDP